MRREGIGLASLGPREVGAGAHARLLPEQEGVVGPPAQATDEQNKIFPNSRGFSQPIAGAIAAGNVDGRDVHFQFAFAGHADAILHHGG
jgi:hypothetical protein